MKYGYMRPIVEDRHCSRQLTDVVVDTVYQEKHGLAKKREALEQLLMIVQTEDELFVQNVEVLADSLQHLVDILRLAERDQLTIHFIDEQMTNQTILTGSFLDAANFFTTLQSSFLSHSSTFSLQSAKEQGKSIGRPRKRDENLERAFMMYDSQNYTLFDIKEATGISKSTLYRYLDSRSTFTEND